MMGKKDALVAAAVIVIGLLLLTAYYFVTLDPIDYFRRPVQGSCKLYFEFGGKVERFEQRSGVKGQKAVCLDVGPTHPEPNLCVVYSFGVSDEDWTFDNIMADYGCDVYTFDPAVVRPVNKSHPRVHYFNWTLGAVDTKTDHRGWRVLTLQSVRSYLMHSYRPIDYLKLDMDGADENWTVLEHLLVVSKNDDSLRQVKQLSISLHLNLDQLDRQKQLIERLEKEQHFTRFFVRRNLWRDNVFDLVWINDHQQQ